MTVSAVVKYLPVIKIYQNTVTVEIVVVPYPIMDAHYIIWIYIQTEKDGQRKAFPSDDELTVDFALTRDDKVLNHMLTIIFMGCDKRDFISRKEMLTYEKVYLFDLRLCI